MSAQILKYAFDATGCPQLGPDIQELWEDSSDTDAWQALLCHCYPVIETLAQFYADQTEQPDIAYDEFLSFGLDVFLQILEKYHEDRAHSFMTTVKRRVNDLLYKECEEYSFSPPAALAEKNSVTLDLDKIFCERRPRIANLSAFSLACGMLSPLATEILYQKIVEGRTAEDIAAHHGITYQAVFKRLERIRDRINSQTPMHVIEEIECLI
jgi:hypothetical protein